MKTKAAIITSSMPLFPRYNLKVAENFPPSKSKFISRCWTSVFCFSNFFTQSLLFTGLELELEEVKVTVKYITAGLA